MLIVALTGGIACGKSVIARLLGAKGCFIHSADRTAHELMSPGTSVWKDVVDHFGSGILHADGTIDRPKLGAIIFGDAAERRFLDATVHPRVIEKTREIAGEVAGKGEYRIFVSEAALVYEAGFAAFYDKVVAASCREDVQVTRLMRRDGIGQDEALRRIRAQMPQEEKIRRADYVIDTSGTIAETIEQTERVHALLMLDGEYER
ncbi:MAG: dephospho-CoA kinase [Candidatus Aminicenantales bacterium]